MRLIPISPSELAFDFFYAPDARTLDSYRSEPDAASGAKIQQIWCRASVSWERGHAGRAVARLERVMPSGGIPAVGHDRLRVFGAVSRNASAVVVCNGIRSVFSGIDDPAYWELPLPKEGIRSLAFEFVPSDDGIGGATLMWLALVDSQADSRRLEQRGRYDSSWEGLLAAVPPLSDMTPRIGIFFGPPELEALRRKVALPAYRPWMDRERGRAGKALAVEPERLIGRFACDPLHYTRPAERPALYGFGDGGRKLESLAFVGLIDQDVDLLRHAARFLLSYAHCEYWYNDFAGELPGTTWHHRSFAESHITYEVALGLDWAGCMLTPEGRDLVLDAIARKGLPRMQQDFMDPHAEYTRRMNQGIVFNSGRILGFLALASSWPRARSTLDSIRADAFGMFDATFTEDGSTVEGPGYWQYTMGCGMNGMVALARALGRPVAELLPPKMAASPGYPAVTASTARAGRSLSIGDSHGSPVCSLELAAMLRHAYPGEDSDALLAYAVRHAEAVGPEATRETPLFLILGPEKIPAYREIIPSFRALARAGQTVVCRPLEGVGLVRLQIVGAPGVGGSHSHDDRGNLLLEAGGEEVLVDRGIGSYSSTLDLLKRPEAHNLCVPDTPDRSAPEQDIGHRSDIWARATELGGVFEASIDTSEAWPEHVKRCVRSVRSPEAGIVEVTDELELQEPLAVTFHLHTPYAARGEGGRWLLRGKRVEASVDAAWEVASAHFAVEDMGIGEHGTAYGHLALRAAPAKAHRLVTRIVVRPAAKR